VELSEANYRNSSNDTQMEISTSQTDEKKIAEIQTSYCSQQSKLNKSRIPCLADTGNYISAHICIEKCILMYSAA